MATAKLLLVDDHAILRSGLRAIIDRLPNLTIVGEAADGREAVRLAAALRPDVIVMDVMMPELNGVDATRQILQVDPNVRVICLTGRTDEQVAADAFAAGAVGFVRKGSAVDELAAAVEAIMAGKRYVCPALSYLLTDPPPGTNGHAKLSAREREVLQLMAEGKATKEVAAALQVSVKTVETHRANLMNKLNLFSVAELTKYAIREGMSSLG